MKLSKKKEQILEVLADELERNPRTSQTGLDLELLGEKVGAYLGIGVMYDVAELRDSGFVFRRHNKVLITQKGLDYVKSHKKHPLQFKLTRSEILKGIIISVTGGLIVLGIRGCLHW